MWLIAFHVALIPLGKVLFVSASHQTGLDTRSMTQRLIIVDIKGGKSQARAKARALLDHAGHQAHLVQCGPDEPN